MEFRRIDKYNYGDCIKLKVDNGQEHFVADNMRSLLEASFEDGLYTLGIYDENRMVGFILYDYDKDIPGWSLSRFMIGSQYQGKGYGKKAAQKFLSYFKYHHNADKIFISVSLDNQVARKMYSDIGFVEVKEIEYEYDGIIFKEIQMVKEFGVNYEKHIDIRQANINDIGSVENLQCLWVKEDITYGLNEAGEEYFKSRLGEYFFVVESENNIIGYACGTNNISKDMCILKDGEQYIEIDDLYILKEYRGLGIGARLLDEVLKRADYNGIKRSILYSSTKRLNRVISFYEEHGYKTWFIEMYK